jgi:hypothetical protein
MKVTVEMDITPQEARQLMGLPDLEPMQEALLEKIQAKMESAIDDMNDPQALMKNYFPVGIQAMDQFQNFFSGIAKAATKNSKD